MKFTTFVLFTFVLLHTRGCVVEAGKISPMTTNSSLNLHGMGERAVNFQPSKASVLSPPTRFLNNRKEEEEPSKVAKEIAIASAKSSNSNAENAVKFDEANAKTFHFTNDQVEDDPFIKNANLNVACHGNNGINSDLLEGDIIVPSEVMKTHRMLQCGEKNNRNYNTRKGVAYDTNLWGKINGTPIVYYYFGSSTVPESNISAAMLHYEEQTCIRFKETTNSMFGYRINFENGTSCSSSIGRSFWSYFGGQTVTLGPQCNYFDIVVHEIGHALGMFHEQARSDRDDHVVVVNEHITPSMTNNFDRQNTNNYDTLYDFYSVMHYGMLAFTKSGSTTLATKDPFSQGLMAQPRIGLSFMDKKLLNTMYGCEAKWLLACNMVASTCKNFGYLSSNCSCACPPGTSGRVCETKTMNYTDALIKEFLPLNENITTEGGNISTPGYPAISEELVLFTKTIHTSSCKHVVLNVTGFDLHNRTNVECGVEGVEIRLGDPLTSGQWYCGKELKPGQLLKSKGSSLVLFYMRSKTANTTGFSFNVTFEENFY